jgi:MFS family permease
MTSKRWTTVLLCFAVLFVLTGVQMAFSVFLVPMSREFGNSVASLALATTICMLVTGFSLPIMGRLVDKYGSRTVILTGAGIAGASTLLLAFASSVWQIYLLYGGLFGFTMTSCGMVATTALISRWFADRRSLALTVFQSAYPVGWFFMVPLAQKLSMYFGWRNSWLTLGVALLLTVLVASLVLREPEGTGAHANLGDTGRTVSLGTAVRTSFFLVLGVAIYFVCGFTDVPFSMLWVPMSLEWGIDEVTASYTLGLMAGIVFLGTIVMGPLPERFGKKAPLTASYMIRTVSLAIPMLLPKSSFTYYSFAVLLAFSFYGMSPIISAWLGEVFGERSMGSLFGLSLFMHFMGSAVGIYLFSLSAETYGTYRLAFASGSALTLLSVVLCLLLRPGKTEVLMH